MPARLDEGFYAELDSRLGPSDAELLRAYPGEPGTRQPVHTVYVPADRFAAALPAEWGRIATGMMDEHLPDATALAAIVGVTLDVAERVRPLVLQKLATEPIEDLRIDFEDGYGPHSDADEDAVAGAGAAELAGSIAAGTAPPYVGIRFKSLEPSTRRRGLRTLDLFLGGLLTSGPLRNGSLPAGFVVTLPKVTQVAQVEAFVSVCETLEREYGLDERSLQFEIQIETPQSVQSADGRATVAGMVQAGLGRVTGLHYGTYDYSAACGVSAANQSLAHPVADHAKAVMQLAAAGTGVRVSDGSTNIVPAGSHDEILAAWRLHAGLVRRSLDRALYQGWDLHPGHLVTRFAATYGFYREGFPAAADRLRSYLGSNSATGLMDEPATAQAMASLLVRGVHSGALTAEEVAERTGVEPAVLAGLYRRRVG
ncbi:MAG: aldolase [Pseudonocardiales bacterium]|nr:aldolase [Pseudonocardiales bacterium]